MLWAMEPSVTVKPSLKVVVDGVIEGGVGGIVTDNPAWEPRA